MSETRLSAAAAQLKAGVSIACIIGEALRLKRDGNLLIGLCPFHGEKTPSFTIYTDHFHCFGCGAHGDVFDWLMQAHRMTFAEAVAYLGGGGTGTAMQSDRPKRHAEAGAGKRNAAIARTIWGECSLPDGTIVEDYLRGRGLELPGLSFHFEGHCCRDEPVLRFHPQCPRGKRERLPAMVALMTDPVTREPRGIHRTFLLPDGSGHIGKMMLGMAGIIRLYEPETAGLGIAEGIETALAVAQRVGWGPVWAVGSAGGIRNFPPLTERTLNIFVDRDDDGVGLSSAEHCASRWAEAGLETFIHTPPTGEDWADAAARITA
jgi:hypothetical protein